MAVNAPPFPEGLPEFSEAWAPAGVPPNGLKFIGCKGTLRAWLLSCPCCVIGWAAIVPIGKADPFGYRLAVEIGCSAGCEGPEVAWWHEWRMGVLPPPAPPTQGQRRYARGAVRRAIGDVLAGKDAIAAARDAGRFHAAAGLNAEHLADAIARAAKRPRHEILTALLAAAASPARLPDAT